MQNERSPGRKYGWVIVGVGLLALVVSNGLTTTGIPVFYKPIQTDLVASGAVSAASAQSFISNGASLTFFLSGVFSMIGGWLIPKVGLKRLMTVGCVCLGLALSLHSQATTVWTIYLSRFLMGVSLGFVGVTPTVVLISSWFRENRGTALGIALTGTSVGGVVIPVLATPAIIAYGWRSAMFIMSLIVWLILLPAIIFLVHEAGTMVGEVTIEDDGLTFAEALKRPVFWIFALCAALVFYPIFAVTQQLILYVQSPRIGMPLETASWLQAILFAVSVGGKSTVGYFSDVFASSRMMLACALVMFLSSLVLLDLTAGNALWFIIPFGFGYGGTFVLLQRLASDYFGMRDYGKILGAIVMIEIIGAAVGGSVTARLADAAGGDYTAAFKLVVPVTAGVLGCAILLNIMTTGRWPSSNRP